MASEDELLKLDIDNATIFNDFMITETSFDNETINYCPTVSSPISNMILVLLFSAVCFVGIIGNSLVIFVVLKFK